MLHGKVVPNSTFKFANERVKTKFNQNVKLCIIKIINVYNQTTIQIIQHCDIKESALRNIHVL